MASNDGDWSQEVIAAAFCVTSNSEVGKNPKIENSSPIEEDEGIASDDSSINISSSPTSSKADSPVSSNGSEIRSEIPIPQRRKPSIKKARPKSECPDRDHSTERHHRNLVGFFRGLVLSKSKDAVMQEHNKLFGRDLKELLAETKQKVPTIVRVCSKCIERHGMVDGIYRLSGISSNIRALKMAFESTTNCNESELAIALECPDFNWRQFSASSRDRNSTEQLVQTKQLRSKPDVHSISSLLKLYFREMPEPLCTFNLYHKFLATAKLPLELKLGATREVVNKLPKEHYDTLEYLMRHLSLVSQYSDETGMTSKNLSIVWAPNLLRSINEESLHKNGGCTNLKDIGLQAVCTEFLIRYPDLIFGDNLPTFSNHTFELGILADGSEAEIDIDQAIAKRSLNKSEALQRPKSLAISTPSKLLTEIDSSNRKQFIEVGGGPDAIPTRYHTVVKLRRAKSSTLAGSCVDSRQQPTENNVNKSSFASKYGLKMRLFHFSRKDRHTMSSTSIHPSTNETSSSTFLNQTEVLSQPSSLIDLGDRKKVQSAILFQNSSKQPESLPVIHFHEISRSDLDWRRVPYKSADSLFAKVRTQVDHQNKVRNQADHQRPNSSSSDTSETDVLGEVNNLKLSFDQEESEMRMMNCCIDDDLNSSSSTSSNGNNQTKLQALNPTKTAPLAVETAPTTPCGILDSIGDSWEAARVSLELENRLTPQGKDETEKVSKPTKNEKNQNKSSKKSESDKLELTDCKVDEKVKKAKQRFSFRLFRMNSGQCKPKKSSEKEPDATDRQKKIHTLSEETKSQEIITNKNEKVETKVETNPSEKGLGSDSVLAGKPQSKEEQDLKQLNSEEITDPRSLETIEEELQVAFENRAYNQVAFAGAPIPDSGFAVSTTYDKFRDEIRTESFYENVEGQSTYYENVEPKDSEAYENVPAKSTTKCDTRETISLSYQNIPFKSETNVIKSKNEGLLYQNLTYGSSAPKNNKSETNNNNNKKSGVNPRLNVEESYENFDFEEESVYQNMILTEDRRMVPAPSTYTNQPKILPKPTKLKHTRTKSSPVKLTGDKKSIPEVFGVPPPGHGPDPSGSSVGEVPAQSDDDIYQKVRALRRSVQEVNALIESEKSFGLEEKDVNQPKKPLVEERSSNFRSILTRWNSIGQKEVELADKQKSNFFQNGVTKR